MAQWTFSDGTVLASGGKVTGDSPLAVALRANSTSAAKGGHIPVVYAHSKGQPISIDLDPSSDWLLDRHARAAAALRKLTLVTDYVARPGDVPPTCREVLFKLAAEEEDEDDETATVVR